MCILCIFKVWWIILYYDHVRGRYISNLSNKFRVALVTWNAIQPFSFDTLKALINYVETLCARGLYMPPAYVRYTAGRLNRSKGV